jgi:DNA polymerase-3 subunit alpha
METLEIKFKKGLSQKGWNEDQINEIWSLMLKQADYSFNRGHAVAYSLLSYLTAYLKTYYPLYFMTACLTAKSDNVSRLSIFINECHRLGIEVCCPNINLSEKGFTAIKDENKILFGLYAIKGIGDAVVDVIIQNRRYSNFNDFVIKTKDTGKISKGIIIKLTKSGAFPTKNKKNFLIKYANGLFETTYKEEIFEERKSIPSVKELKEVWKIDTDVIKDKQERLQLFNQQRKIKFDNEEVERTFKKEDEKQKYIDEFSLKYLQEEFMWEFETLSMFITYNPLKEAYKYVTPWDEVNDGDKATVICVIVDIKRKKDKNNNSFAYLDLYTPYGIIEATCWARQYKDFNDLIINGLLLTPKVEVFWSKIIIITMIRLQLFINNCLYSC